MRLTGQCKEDFLNYCKQSESFINTYADIYLNSLIIEWFDSVGIYISIMHSSAKYNTWYYGVSKINFDDVELILAKDKNRSQVTNIAIDKANDIYNNTYKN